MEFNPMVADLRDGIQRVLPLTEQQSLIILLVLGIIIISLTIIKVLKYRKK